MNKAHSPINWVNEPNTDTPINATNLNQMDNAIGTIDDRVITLYTTKAEQADLLTAVADITFNETTGVITVTKKNGASTQIDTKLEKLAINFSYDAGNQQLVIHLDDGTYQYVDLKALITELEFLNSDTVLFSVSADGKVTASIVKGSITEEMFDPTYLAEIKLYSSQAVSSATNAQTYATEAKESADSAKQLNDESKELLEQVKKTVSVVDFDINENGYLTYTTDTDYIFGVDNDGNLTWEVA